MDGLHHHHDKSPNLYQGAHDHDDHGHWLLWFFVIIALIERGSL